MGYTERFAELKRIYSHDLSSSFDGTEFKDILFSSCAYKLLPGNSAYCCEQHGQFFKEGCGPINHLAISEDHVNIQDVSVKENREFIIRMMKPTGEARSKKVVLLFHGFNEKNWEKYLPWGEYICKSTGSAVVFFPIAFHMQRAPMAWSERREMFRLSEARKKQYPNVLHSTLSNVAISVRVHAMPQRFVWSGLQTYFDVLAFVDSCRMDKQPFISPDCHFDMFAYSIGGLLAQSIKLTDYKGYFADSKVCLFCSGAVFNRHSPVSKFILDSEANVALYSYLIEHFDSYLKTDSHLRHYIHGDHPEGVIFHSLLDYQKMRSFRETLLRQHQKEIYAIALSGDSVIPYYEVVNTLQGASRNIRIRVDEIDFPYDYIHENPFPTGVPFADQVDAGFEHVFSRVSAFLKK